MSTLTFEKKKEHTIKEEKESIVNLFHAYCSHEFGNDRWVEFMNHKEFNNMLTKYQPIYGDIIFSVIADIVSEIENIHVKDLLRNFAEFIRTYY